MTNNINKVPTDYLLAMYLEYTFQDKRLLTINRETLLIITQDLNERFPDMYLTTDDIKSAWICWIEESAHNGCAISPHLSIAGEQPWQHKESAVIDKFIEVATEAINSLHSAYEANDNLTWRDPDNLKNLCEWLTDHEDFKQQYTEEFGINEAGRLFSEHTMNLIADSGIDSALAEDIADKLTGIFF